MIIPEKVRIGSCDYDVEFTDRDLVVNHKECYARIFFENHLIQINDTLGDIQQQELAFLHELVHGIVDERGLELENEELIVNEIAKGLHQIIRDNPIMFLNEEDIEFVEEETQ